jgi:hypothetical protein
MTNNSFEILLVYQYARFKNYPGSWFASVLPKLQDEVS